PVPADHGVRNQQHLCERGGRQRVARRVHPEPEHDGEHVERADLVRKREQQVDCEHCEHQHDASGDDAALVGQRGERPTAAGWGHDAALVASRVPRPVRARKLLQCWQRRLFTRIGGARRGIFRSRRGEVRTAVKECPVRSSAAVAEKTAPLYYPAMANATVLVVDDEALVRWSLKERLAREGYNVLEAGTAAAALEQAGEAVDLILLDYRLPDSDGLVVLKKV